MRFLIMFICLLAMPLTTFAELPVGEVPPTVTLSGKDGGRLDGSAWSSSEIKGKIYTFWYVDPDEKDTNNHVSDRLKEEAFPIEKVASIACINMGATWLPNFAIESSLKEKQEEFPNTIYLKDFKKVLVKEWDFANNSSNVAAFDQEGKVIFSKDGKLSDSDVENLVQAIKNAL